MPVLPASGGVEWISGACCIQGTYQSAGVLNFGTYRIDLLIYLKFKNMGFTVLFLMILLSIKECFKVIDHLLKIALSTGLVISHCSPLSIAVFKTSTVKSAVQKCSIEALGRRAFIQ